MNDPNEKKRARQLARFSRLQNEVLTTSANLRIADDTLVLARQRRDEAAQLHQEALNKRTKFLESVEPEA